MSTSKLSKSRKQLETARRVWPMVKDYYVKARRAKLEKKLVVWTVGISPVEIFHALGVTPIMVEYFIGVLASKQQLTRYLELVAAKGYPTTACSYHLGVIGCSFSGEELMIPAPDFIFGTSNPCDNPLKTFDPVLEHFRVPSYFLDSAFYIEGGEREEIAVEYYESQLKEFIFLIERLTGNPLKEERLKETFGLAMQAYNLWREINDLRKAIPCPMGVVDEVGTMYPLMQIMGTAQAVGFYQLLKAEVEERVNKGQGVIDEEKHRLLWLGPTPCYDTSLLNYFEDYGAVLVKSDVDFGYLPEEVDEERPLKSISRKMIKSFFNSLLPARMQLTRKMAEDYRIDGVVAYSHLGCRIYSGGQKATIDAVRDDFKVPVLLLEGDIADCRNYNPIQIRNQIEGFLELL